MEYNEIRRLLERYLDAETTLAEEETLRRYFTSATDLPEDLKYAAPMFAYAAQGRSVKTPLAPKATLSPVRRRRTIAALAAAVAACTVLGAVIFSHGDTGDVSDIGDMKIVYCYVDGVAVTDRAEAEKIAGRVLGGVDTDIEESARMLATLTILTR